VIIEEGTPVIVRGTARPRWAVAVVAAVAILAVAMGGVAGAFLVTGRSGGGTGIGNAASYVPADSVSYMDARLDLPGDQRAMLTQLLGHFGKVDVDQVIGDGLGPWIDAQLKKGDAPFSYSSDVATWFDGRVAMAILDYPSMQDATAGKTPHLLAFAGVRDRAAATAFAAKLRADAEKQGASFSSTTHRGVEVVSASHLPEAGHAGKDAKFAYAITDDEVIFSPDPDRIATALDVHAGATPAVAGRTDLASLAPALPADRIGTMVVSCGPIVAQLRKQLEAAGTSGAVADAFASFMPTLAMGAVRAEGDRVRFDLVTTPAQGVKAANRDRGLDQLIPADAIFVSEGNDVGPALARMVTAAKQAGADVMGADGKKRIAQVESVLGTDLESFVSWIGDAALVAGYDGEQPYGGLILSATDLDAARSRLNQLVGLARLGGQQGVSVSDSKVGDTTLTTIRIHESGDATPISEVVVQYALADGHVLIGFGDRFVSNVLELDPADALASSQRYRAAMDGVGGMNNAGGSYLDLQALRGALESALQPLAPKGEWQTYEEQVRPWLLPLDYLAGAARADGDRLVQRSAVVVK
jgi:hypothetical protein